MKEYSAKDARDKLADIVNTVAYGGERVVFTRRGQAVAALISLEDLAFLERSLREAEDAEDAYDATQALKRAQKKGGTISFDQVVTDLDLDV